MPVLWRRILLNSGAQAYGTVISLITLSLTARLLGPEGRGEAAALTGWVGLFVVMAGLSLDQSAFRQAARAQTPKENWLPPALTLLLSAAVLLGLGTWLAAWGVHQFSSGHFFRNLSPALLLLAFAAAPLALLDRYSASLCAALDREGIVSRAQILARTAAVLLTCLFVGVWHWGVAGVIASLQLALLLAAGWNLRFLLSQVPRLARPNWPQMRATLLDGIKLHPATICTALAGGVDVLLLHRYQGAAAAGYYQLAAMLAALHLTLSVETSNLLRGKIVGMGALAAWGVQRRLLWQTSLFVAAMLLFTSLTAHWWLPWIAGGRFAQAVVVLRWLLVGVLLSNFSTLMVSQWLARARLGWFTALNIATGLGSVALGLLLIPRYGLFGAVASSLATQSLAFLAHASMAVYCERLFRHSRQSAPSAPTPLNHAA